MNFAAARTLRDVIEKPLPPPEFLIAPLLERESFVMLNGPPKWGKTLLALNIAMDVIAGRPVLGELHPLRPLRVIYFKAEAGNRPFEQRLRKMVTSVPVTDEMKDRFLYVPLFGQSVLEPAVKDFLVKMALDFRADLLIFDPLARFHSSLDENNTSQMLKVYQRFEEIARNTGTGIVIVHHGVKNPGESREVAHSGRGGAAGGGADASAILACSRSNGFLKVDFSLRDGEVEPMFMEFNAETCWLTPVERDDIVAAKNPKIAEFVKINAGKVLSRKELMDGLQACTGKGPRMVQRYIKHGEAAGLWPTQEDGTYKVKA